MSLLAGSSFVLPLIREFFKVEAVKKMKKAETKTVAGMRRDGFTLGNKSFRACTRDAIYRLVRATGLGGYVTDKVRDYLEDQVVPIVEEKVGTTPTLDALVPATREAMLEVIEDLVS